jgi:hypothetical protein
MAMGGMDLEDQKLQSYLLRRKDVADGTCSFSGDS